MGATKREKKAQKQQDEIVAQMKAEAAERKKNEEDSKRKAEEVRVGLINDWARSDNDSLDSLKRLIGLEDKASDDVNSYKDDYEAMLAKNKAIADEEYSDLDSDAYKDANKELKENIINSEDIANNLRKEVESEDQKLYKNVSQFLSKMGGNPAAIASQLAESIGSLKADTNVRNNKEMIDKSIATNEQLRNIENTRVQGQQEQRLGKQAEVGFFNLLNETGEHKLDNAINHNLSEQRMLANQKANADQNSRLTATALYGGQNQQSNQEAQFGIDNLQSAYKGAYNTEQLQAKNRNERDKAIVSGFGNALSTAGASFGLLGSK